MGAKLAKSVNVWFCNALRVLVSSLEEHLGQYIIHLSSN